MTNHVVIVDENGVVQKRFSLVRALTDEQIKDLTSTLADLANNIELRGTK